MHTPISSNKTVFKEFPRAVEIQPDREPRRFAPVQPKDVPPALKSVAGAPRNRAQERFFTRHFPEPNFKLGALNQTYHRVVAADPSYVGETYRRLAQKYGNLIERVNTHTRHYHELPAAQSVEPATSMTDTIRNKAFKAGADLVGFTHFDRAYVTAETKREARFKHVIVLCRAFDWQVTQGVPSIDWDVHSYDTSLALALGALELADFIRARGYRVQFIAGTGLPGETMIAPILPYAIAAGIGQVGANGTMLTPEFGSRVRVMGLSTDAPVSHGKPADYGINVLCDECQVCVNRCPGRALSKFKIDWRGVSKYKVVTERCFPLLRFAECNVCTKVCPVQHFGLKAVLEHYRETDGEILGKGSHAVEGYTLFDKGYFGPGELPRFSVEEGGKGLTRMAEHLDLD